MELTALLIVIASFLMLSKHIFEYIDVVTNPPEATTQSDQIISNVDYLVSIDDFDQIEADNQHTRDCYRKLNGEIVKLRDVDLEYIKSLKQANEQNKQLIIADRRKIPSA